MKKQIEHWLVYISYSLSKKKNTECFEWSNLLSKLVVLGKVKINLKTKKSRQPHKLY